MTVLVLATLVTVVPLAYASPPDPTWVPGFYDNADFDEAVLAVVSVDAATSAEMPILLVSKAVVPVSVHRRPVLRDNCPELATDRSPPVVPA